MWKQFIQTLWCHNVYGKGHQTFAERPCKLHLSHQLQGVKCVAQQCHYNRTPASFGASFRAQKCQGINAPKGRVQHPDAGYVNQMSILPEQFTGGHRSDAEMLWCLRPRQFLGQRKNAEMSFHTYPRGSCMIRRNAITIAPPLFLFGARTQMQQCQKCPAPREGPRYFCRNAM